MGTTARRQLRLPLPELPDWIETIPSRLAWHPLGERLGVRIEESVEDDRYIVRAEVPGADPEQDLEVSVERGELTIRAERRERGEAKQHSEFRYGSFSRTVTLPPEAREDDIEAGYSAGILTVSVGLAKEEKEGRRIEIRHGG